MKVPVAVLALAGLVISAATCVPAADEEPAGDETAAAADADMPSAEAGIAEADAAFAAAWDAGDGAAMASLYTEDAMVLPPGGEAVEGREAITAFWQGFIESLAGSQVALETTEVHSGDGAAIEAGSWAITGADGGHIDHGKYIVVWKYVDGAWRLHRDIFNSSMEQ
ncbi:MAG: SgcJ/EcaC family oxidoreductase [Gemmatimonadota bacterium]